MLHQERKPYDLPQAIKSALDALDNVPVANRLSHNTEDFAKFFCSELVAAGLEHSGAIPHLNASEVTPSDPCMFSIYRECFLLKGADREIKGFNTLSPEGWGE